MGSTLKITASLIVAIALSSCSSAPKDEYDDSMPQYDDSSQLSETDTSLMDTGSASDDYADDSYGDTSYSASSTDYDTDTSYDSYESQTDTSSDPLPVQELSSDSYDEPVTDTPSFKDGFYHIGSNCNMRAEPDKNARHEGLIPKGKRLWVEGYSESWVKVFKRSGPVYIHKSCL